MPNLRMLMADMITSISLTDDERKKVGIRNNANFLIINRYFSGCKDNKIKPIHTFTQDLSW